MRLVKFGDGGESVRFLQKRLVANGFKLSVDGDFGPSTLDAVEQFQGSMGVKVDGAVGDQTWQLLLSERSVEVPIGLMMDSKSELHHAMMGQLGLVQECDRDVIRRMLEYAIGFLGEKENPNGSNDGPGIHEIVEGFNRYWWSLRDNSLLGPVRARGFALEGEADGAQPWCGMFVSNSIRVALGLPVWDFSGYSIPLDGHPFDFFLGGAQAIEDWGHHNKKVVDVRLDVAALPGDLFTTTRGNSGSDDGDSGTKAGHIGIVVADDDEYVITIEGNIGNAVGTRRRKKTTLRKIIRWR